MTVDRTPEYLQGLLLEHQIAAEQVTAEQVLGWLDYPAYFELTDTPLPDNRDGISLFPASYQSLRRAWQRGG